MSRNKRKITSIMSLMVIVPIFITSNNACKNDSTIQLYNVINHEIY